LRRKLAEAVALAKQHGARDVDEALATAAAAGRFGDGDLAAILAHRDTQVIEFPARERAAVAAAVHGRLGPAERPPLPAEVDRLLAPGADAFVRRAAPEVIATAIAQCWEPAEVMRGAARRDSQGPRRGNDQDAPPPLGLAARRTLGPGRTGSGGGSRWAGRIRSRSCRC
jgi:hypothetical protein